MTASPELAARLAGKVADHIESTRAIILQNIEKTIRDELILHGAGTAARGDDRVEALHAAARHMCAEISAHGMVGQVASCFDRAFTELSKALEGMRP